MKSNSSSRSFLQAGLTLSAARLDAPGLIGAISTRAAGVSQRKLGKTGLKVSTVGYGVGFTPEVSRAIECPNGVHVQERLDSGARAIGVRSLWGACSKAAHAIQLHRRSRE